MATTKVPPTTITVELVENTNNFTALMTMAQELKLDVPLDKQNVTGFKTILVKHLMKKGGSETVKGPKDWDTTSAASTEDLSHRLILREFYKRTQHYITTLPEPFQVNLQEFFPGYKQQLATYFEELKTSKCVLLIAGETGAGKSSFVNLLLGVPILPTSDLKCTAAIVEIQYGPTPYAEMHFLDDSSGKSRHPIKAQGDITKRDEFIKEMEKHIKLRDNETDESPYAKIQIYWPLEMLKGGATIVDSPGVGDSRALPQQLTDYMERAFGFIYVIDSGAAIHKHRLGQLLVKASENNNDTFDLDTAMFVLNRWDLISPGDSKRVLDSLADRLAMIVPGVKKSQMFPISIKESRASVEYGQVREQHQQMIEGIRRFLPLTMTAKLRIYYRYLSGVLKRSLYALRLSYLNTKNSVSKMQDEVVKRDTRRKMLEKEAQDKLDAMRKEVRGATIEASDGLRQHLNSMHVQTRLCTWRDTDIPRKESKWQNIVKSANMLLSERLAYEINEWENSSRIVDNVGRTMMAKFQKAFQLFTNEVAQIEGVFLESDDRKVFMDVNQMQKNVNQKKPMRNGRDAGFMR